MATIIDFEERKKSKSIDNSIQKTKVSTTSKGMVSFKGLNMEINAENIIFKNIILTYMMDQQEDKLKDRKVEQIQ
jgi:hypothetical protein